MYCLLLDSQLDITSTSVTPSHPHPASSVALPPPPPAAAALPHAFSTSVQSTPQLRYVAAPPQPLLLQQSVPGNVLQLQYNNTNKEVKITWRFNNSMEVQLFTCRSSVTGTYWWLWSLLESFCGCLHVVKCSLSSCLTSFPTDALYVWFLL